MLSFQPTTTATPVPTTQTGVSPTTPVAWDAVPFGQIMYKQDGVFVVLDNVTKVDVICIGKKRHRACRLYHQGKDQAMYIAALTQNLITP